MLDLAQLSFDFGALPRWEPFRSVRELPPAAATPPPPVLGKGGQSAGQGKDGSTGTTAQTQALVKGETGAAGAGLAASGLVTRETGAEGGADIDADLAGDSTEAARTDTDPHAKAGTGTATEDGHHPGGGPHSSPGHDNGTGSANGVNVGAQAAQPILDGRDATLEEEARGWLHALEMPGGARLLTVTWNARLRSTAGYARYPSWAIELNPRLAEFEGQVERTLKHELAHLIAYHRAGRRRIEPHGREWRAACADLGIPDEKACHRLPLPRNAVERKLTYACPACQTTVHRVRKFRRPTACLHCCNRHAGGRYDGRFRLVLVGGS